MVVLPPGLHDLAGITQAQEPMLVQAFVTHAAMETLAVGVLDRFARVDELQVNAMLAGPLAQHVADEFRAIVQDDLCGEWALTSQSVQDADDAASRQTGVDFQGERLPGEDIDDAQDPDRAAGGQRVVQEIQRPLLIRTVRQDRATAPQPHHGLAATPTHREAFFAIEPLDPLVVDDDPFPAQQDLEAPVAKAWASFSQLAQPGTQRLVIPAPTPVPDGCPRRANQLTCAALRKPKVLLGVGHCGPPVRGPHQFFRRSSFRAWLSSACSATRRLSRAFSSSSAFSR